MGKFNLISCKRNKIWLGLWLFFIYIYLNSKNVMKKLGMYDYWLFKAKIIAMYYKFIAQV